MPRTNWQDPGSSEVRSTHISGLQEAVGKIEDILNMQLQAETNVELSEVYISEQNRYRIFQAPEGKRNWASDPAPVIKKNGVPIASGFVIDYGGGAVIFSTPLSGTDTVTADFSRVKIEGSIIDGLVEVAHDHDNYDVLALLSEDVDGTLLYNGVPIGATPDAGDIPYDNEESELEATKVQGAIDETVDMVKTHKAENANVSHGVVIAESDDYEEGEFTPYYFPENGEFDYISYVATSGKYVKQGNTVTFFANIVIRNLTKGSASGYVRIGGFPFIPAIYTPINLGRLVYFQNIDVTGHLIRAWIASDGTCRFRIHDPNLTAADEKELNVDNLTETSESNRNFCMLSGIYIIQ